MDTQRDSLKSYADAVGRVIRQESWLKTEKKFKSNAEEGRNEITHFNRSQPFGNQRSGGKVGFNKIETMLRISKVDRVDDVRAMLAIRRKMGLVIKVDSISQDRTSKPVRVLSSGHFAASVRDDIWVIVSIHQIVLNYGKPGHLARDFQNYYNCGKPDHFFQACLDQGKVEQKQSNARVYVLTQVKLRRALLMLWQVIFL